MEVRSSATPPPPQTALQLLEKNVHEKQDTIVGLRRQLEEMKTANLKMATQIKVRVQNEYMYIVYTPCLDAC